MVLHLGIEPVPKTGPHLVFGQRWEFMESIFNSVDIDCQAAALRDCHLMPLTSAIDLPM